MPEMRALYVETLIRAPLDEVWRVTQDPAEHQRWDLRFARITYLPGEPGAPTRFRYATRLLGVEIAGTGITVGERDRADGTRTSALRFASPSRLSPIRAGAGYWRYIPTAGGIRFLTGYQYRPGFGRTTDRLVRPLLGWATAWSFDRLRLWLERGITPRRALVHTAVEVGIRILAVAAAATIDLRLCVLMGLVASVVPPAAVTPAARRCRRQPPDAVAGQAPHTLARLEPV
jgi:hypothetical protein